MLNGCGGVGEGGGGRGEEGGWEEGGVGCSSQQLGLIM